MSAGGKFQYKCPKCGEVDELHVSMVVWRQLVQTSGGNLATVPSGGRDREWDGSAQMICGACGHGAVADDFNVEEQIKEAGLRC